MQTCHKPVAGLNLYCNHGGMGFILNHFYDIKKYHY